MELCRRIIEAIDQATGRDQTMIGRKAEAVLNLAVRYAVDRDHEYFTLEHVLWALLGEERCLKR